MIEFPHSVFADDEFLGRDAIYTPAGGQSRSIRVTFTKDMAPLPLGGQVTPSDYEAQAGCALSLISDAAKGDTLEVDDVTYVIDKIHSDETGWATMFLVEPL